MKHEGPSTEDLRTVGGRIRIMRQAKGWKQTTFALKLGASQASVSQWEANNWLPGSLMRKRIASVLDASESFLFGDLNERQAS